MYDPCVPVITYYLVCMERQNEGKFVNLSAVWLDNHAKLELKIIPENSF